MEKKLLLLLLTIPSLAIILTWSILNSSTRQGSKIVFPEHSTQTGVADTFFNNTTIIDFGEDGLPKSKIIGKQLFHYPDKEDSEIIEPVITFFRSSGSPVLVTSDRGWINEDGTRVLLKGHTIIERQKSAQNHYSKLATPELIVWPDKEYAETDKAVKITSESTVATGIGMKAFLDKEHYFLLNNVKSRHVPVREK